MRRKNRPLLVLLILFLVVSASCARTPTVKKSEHVMDRYFHKYGNKFDDSDLGKYKIESVRTFDIAEVHKHLVAVTAEVKLLDGPVYNVRCMLQKKTLGWRLVSWERL